MSGHVAILGGGAWGSALACVARRTGHQVHVWVRDAETATCIQDGSNPRRLPGIPLARGITAGTDLTFAVSGADCILIAVPAQALRSVAQAIAPHLSSGIPIAICAKGVERNTLKRMSQILAEETPTARACIFSGPTL
ncbi:MAG TPA: glycerol-3-phosphate dehydrogenase, partial [Rhodospirillaceae bacterium]|nr:glycerol-3-phosphate dehydrogenase [Rhodospirillaceae bacterium]